jgi:mutator protein MutT
VAVAVVFRRSPGGVELLIGRRHKEAIRGGLYEFPGGKIEPGESPNEAALREVEEEVGLGRDDVVDGPTALAISAHSDPELARERSVRLHAFLVEVCGDARPRALGSGEVRWIRVDELGNFEWPKANAAINDAIRGAFGDGARR